MVCTHTGRNCDRGVWNPIAENLLPQMENKLMDLYFRAPEV